MDLATLNQIEVANEIGALELSEAYAHDTRPLDE